ncbi:MAG: type II toxin-antitoxin system HicA family toxin [Coriobacteriales bacterium]|jgi:predicted RNA binding protein YcfA (HicA-like mRNA interferase family)|nr:type II toxin-antitoxin system HicA family toxin [Coriobacteriales bacterium]
MPLTPREIIRLLEKNGYVVIGSNGSHRKLFNPQTNKTIIVPFHNKELKKGTERGIRRQAGLDGR